MEKKEGDVNYPPNSCKFWMQFIKANEQSPCAMDKITLPLSR